MNTILLAPRLDEIEGQKGIPEWITGRENLLADKSVEMVILGQISEAALTSPHHLQSTENSKWQIKESSWKT